jgi:hypothetical protein
MIVPVAVPCKSCLSQKPENRQDLYGTGFFATISGPYFVTKQTYTCRNCGWQVCYTYAQLKKMQKVRNRV